MVTQQPKKKGLFACLSQTRRKPSHIPCVEPVKFIAYGQTTSPRSKNQKYLNYKILETHKKKKRLALQTATHCTVPGKDKAFIVERL